ncbi:MAG TPA: helix-turn-helix domain-containing protein [Acidimicrobiales bacterium]|jgi:HTH-type transcriptional regulator/antitoxin HipB|nr:helix-turn-helix domain-containing protein [Acidimicrobiales bacterium]
MATSEPSPGNLWPIRAPEDIGAALRDFRLARGLSQAQLAQMIGVDRQYVSELESGKATEQLRRLVAAFSVLGTSLYVGAKRVP